MKQEENVDNWLNDYKIEVEWHTGDPGSGKTYYAKQIGRQYRKEGKSVAIIEFDDNGFSHILGNETAELLIMNEFRDSNLKFNKFLEILTNEYQHNIKNGNLYFPNIKRIIITSVFTPLNIYMKINENREQIYRRITKIYYHQKLNNKYDMKEISLKELDELYNYNVNLDDIE